MTPEQILEKACAQPTLAEALSFAAICEMERVAPKIREGGQWETMFGFLFKMVLAKWDKAKV